jgi:hypothetical protein
MNVTVKPGSVASLKQALKDTTRKLQAELRVAVNATANKSKSIINKEIRSELATTAKAVNQTIRVKSKAQVDNITATVEVKKTARISLREFGARQNKSGTSYRISKSQGRKTVKGGFQGPKPGVMKASWRGHTFKRVGQTRLPIVKLFGPSPWGVMTKGDKLGPSEEQIQAELSKQIERRVRFITLKKTGAI